MGNIRQSIAVDAAHFYQPSRIPLIGNSIDIRIAYRFCKGWVVALLANVIKQRFRYATLMAHLN